jgi:hypothetical protein
VKIVTGQGVIPNNGTAEYPWVAKPISGYTSVEQVTKAMPTHAREPRENLSPMRPVRPARARRPACSTKADAKSGATGLIFENSTQW